VGLAPRTPALFDVAVAGPFTVAPPSAATGGLPALVSFAASPGFFNESVNDFEAGYRGQITKAFSADLSLFYDQYSNIRSADFVSTLFAPYPAPHLVTLGVTNNGTEAVGKGAESSIAWQVLAGWKLEGSYTYNIFNPWLGSSDPPGTEYGSLRLPSHNKWRLQSYINISKAWKLDTFIYFTSSGDPLNNLGPNIPVPSYARLDVRLGYQQGPHWRLSLAGQNLLEARHLEAVADLLSLESYVNRSVYLKSTWQF
jgi:iron complex outermembrane receptor protein